MKFQSKPGADHAGEGGNGTNGVGNGGAGHDTLTGGHDTMVGGHDAGAGVTKLGVMKLPDLSGIKAGASWYRTSRGSSRRCGQAISGDLQSETGDPQKKSGP